MTEEVLLNIEDLKTYAENNGRFLRIVDGVSFDIKENEVVALFGECGCGKSTIAYSIMGAVRYMPGIIGGKIHLKGEGNLLAELETLCSVKNENGRLEIKKDVKKWNRIYEQRMGKVRGKRLFLVMQGAKSSLNPFWKIKEQVEEISKSDINVEAIFKKLHLEDKLERFPHQLSGGECQRALLAMGLTSRTELLIIDEPTVGIDNDLMDEIINLLVEYKEGKFGDNAWRSLLLISHDRRVIERLADRVVVICSGRIVEVGKKDEIIKNPQHPYTQRLIESYQTPANKDEPLSVIKGAIPPLYKKYEGCRFYSRCEEPKKDARCATKEPDMPLDDTHSVRCYWPIKRG